MRKPSELITICQNQSQKFDMMVVKWKQWYRKGLSWKVEIVVLKWAGQEKLKQWYGNGLLWKVETVVLKWAVMEI